MLFSLRPVEKNKSIPKSLIFREDKKNMDTTEHDLLSDDDAMEIMSSTTEPVSNELISNEPNSYESNSNEPVSTESLTSKIVKIDQKLITFTFGQHHEPLQKSLTKLKRYNSELELKNTRQATFLTEFQETSEQRNALKLQKSRIANRLLELQKTQNVYEKLKKFQQNDTDLDLYSELLENDVIPRVPVLQNKFRDIERSLMTKAEVWWSSVRVLKESEFKISGSKSFIVNNVADQISQELFFKFVDVELEIEFLKKHAKLIISKEVSFSSGNFKQVNQTAVEALNSLGSFVNYYKKFIQKIIQLDDEKTKYDIVMPSDIQTLTTIIGKEMPSEKSEFENFMVEIRNVDGLNEFPIWTQFIENAENTRLLKLQARQLLIARQLVTVSITRDKLVEINPDYNSELFGTLPSEEAKHSSLILNLNDLKFVKRQAYEFQGTITSSILKLTELDSSEFKADNFMKLYLNLTPTVHEKAFDQSFRNVVLMYNNSAFLAQKFKNKIDGQLILRLRYMSHDLLNLHLTSNFKTVLTNLKQKMPKMETSGLKDKGENLIQAVIDKLELTLVPVSKLMAKHVFFKTLIQPILKKIISEIVSILVNYEDIIQEEGSNWREVLSNFKDNTFEMFSDSIARNDLLEVLDHINQIVFLLDCSLSELEDTWADGRGPLARYFSKREIRCFIRALWSNNDKRATVLEKLK